LKIESSFCSSVLSLLSVPAIAEGNCGRKRYVTLFYTRVYEQFAKQRKQTRASDKNQAHWCTDWRRQQLDIQGAASEMKILSSALPAFALQKCCAQDLFKLCLRCGLRLRWPPNGTESFGPQHRRLDRSR
jgi:hypothetical protein